MKKRMVVPPVLFAAFAVFGCEGPSSTELPEDLAPSFGIEDHGEGLRIRVKAHNRSTTDRPFCGIGGGQEGDRLDVKVVTDLSGVTTGTATFEPATGPAITLKIDRVLSYCCGGLALIDSSNGNTIALWLDEGNAPMHINVELPRGCENTQSTFTAGVDKPGLRIALH